MLKTYYILTILLLSICIKSSGQHSFVADTTAKKLSIKTAVKEIYYSNRKTPSTTYTDYYDINGKLTERISFNNNFNSISIKEFYFYNNKGQLIKEKDVNYNLKDSSIYIQSYSYNSKGLIDNNSYGKIQYRYDRIGRVIESNEKTAKPSDLKYVFTYDSLGNLKYKEEYFYNSLQEKRSWEYNFKRQIVKETSTYYDSQNEALTSEYENTFIYNEAGLLSTEYQKQTIVPAKEAKSEDRIYKYEYTFY